MEKPGPFTPRLITLHPSPERHRWLMDRTPEHSSLEDTIWAIVDAEVARRLGIVRTFQEPYSLRRVRETLAEAAAPMTVSEIARTIQATVQTAKSAARALIGLGDAAEAGHLPTGARPGMSYVITEQGLERLSEIKKRDAPKPAPQGFKPPPRVKSLYQRAEEAAKANAPPLPPSKYSDEWIASVHAGAGDQVFAHSDPEADRLACELTPAEIEEMTRELIEEGRAADKAHAEKTE